MVYDATQDPTMRFLAEFDDSLKWEIVPNVPLMVPHQRTAPDGTTYKVGSQRLDTIRAVMDQIEAEDGVLPKIQIGHTVKGGPEAELLGFVRNRRIGEWGPKRKEGLLGDFWFHKDKYPKAAGHPFRSPEFYPVRNQISAVALLSRDPELDMGAVSFSRIDDCIFYNLQEESAPMPEIKPPVPAPAPAPLPVARDLSVDDQVRMAREEMAVEYKRQGDVIARLEKDLEVERYHRREATAEQQVTQLRAEGYIVKNTANLVKKLAGMAEDAAKAELVEIRENYSRAPLEAPTIRTAEVADNSKQCSREDYERAVRLATNEKITFDAALLKIRGITK
jgi:hypothetical protein